MTPDIINGLFELVGSLAIWANVRALLKHKQIRGVDFRAVFFFTAWGAWNLYYYPHLGQIYSLLGGVSLFIANAVWIVLAVRYDPQNRLHKLLKRSTP